MPFLAMDQIRKMSSKVLKKAPPSSPPSAPPPVTKASLRDRLKHSHSMPLRSSGAKPESDVPRLVYRGPHPLKTCDIKYTEPPVLDISIAGEQRRRYHDTTYDDYSSDDEEPTHYNHVIDGQTLDEFPIPPTINAYTTPPIPPRRPYTRSNAADEPYPTDLLPPNPYFERLEREQGQERQRQLEQQNYNHYRQPTLQRSSSNSSYSRPTPNAYPNLANLTRPQLPPSINRSHTHPPSARPLYSTSHLNHSTKSLHSQPRLVPGPIAHRPVIRQASTPLIHRPVRRPSTSTLPKHPPSNPKSARVTNDPSEKTQRMRLPSNPAQYVYIESDDSQYSAPKRYGAHTVHGRTGNRF